MGASSSGGSFELSPANGPASNLANSLRAVWWHAFLASLLNLIAFSKVNLMSAAAPVRILFARNSSNSNRLNNSSSTSSSSFDERRQRQRERTKEFCSRLKPHVARITAKEVGLAAEEEEEEEPKSFFTSLLKRVKKKYSRTFSSRSVYSQTVYGCENFQISTFIIPKGMEIPLHNHPAMTVFSKCLYGSAKVQTYKWKDGNYEYARAHKPRACELVSDVVITALDDSVQVCSPEENIHRVVALSLIHI